jgi:hypothetical protein
MTEVASQPVVLNNNTEQRGDDLGWRYHAGMISRAEADRLLQSTQRGSHVFVQINVQ